MSAQASTYQTVVNEGSRYIIEAGVSAAVGYCCSYAFNIINPVHGAVYCVVSTLVSKLVQPLFEMAFNRDGASHSSVVVARVFSILTSAAVSAFIATLAGFPISMTTGLILSGVMFAAYLTTTIFIAVVGGAIAYNAVTA